MIGIIIRRGLQLIPVLLGVTILTFLLVNLLPGNVAVAMLGPQAGADAVANLEHQLGLDQPIYLRYLHWLIGALHGDLGYSIVLNQEVIDVVFRRFAVTAEIILLGQFVGLLVAIPVGVFSLMRPDGFFDRIAGLCAYAAIATPRFLLGLLFILAFAVYWNIFPSIGYSPLSDGLLANLWSIALPVFTIAALEFAIYFRVLRSEMFTQNQLQYVVAARAKGISRLRVLLRHVLVNSLIALVTIVGLNFGPLVSGAVIVESLFSLPGVGELLINSIYQRDVVMVQGAVVVVATAVVLLNFLVDIAHLFIDPRIRYGVGD